jgi:hypothetical protein
MKPLLPALLLGLGLSSATITPAAAYPVDCAILLCLAGGWPASAECAHARAVFIRRITPWPIEPPLQIWNCPMRIGYRAQTDMERLLTINFHLDPSPPQTTAPGNLQPVRTTLQADIDLSDPAFDFLRSIRVYQIEYWQRENGEGSCRRATKLWLGTYSAQGEYVWSRSDETTVPNASAIDPPRGCTRYEYRSVLVEWRDFEGRYDHEEVRY